MHALEPTVLHESLQCLAPGIECLQGFTPWDAPPGKMGKKISYRNSTLAVELLRKSVASMPDPNDNNTSI